MIKFTKMHGLGNDFMVVDCVHQTFEPTASEIERLADRHFGVGFDQLLLIEKAKDANADFFYRIFNADGREVSQCGNGARCLAEFIHAKGLSDKKHLRVATRAGILELQREKPGVVTVNMGVPKFQPAEIPFLANQVAESYALETEQGTLEIGALSMGNPHCVLRVDSVVHAPVLTLGAILSQHPHFPEETNVGFMQVNNENEITLRVYERGAGETLACGSGACAAVVWGQLRGWLSESVKVNLPGGALMIRWAGPGQPVWMTGPAVSVFEGTI
jgi:diaminopimelate epimerase